MRGENITVGYLHDPEATKKTFTKDGWLRTGDVAEMDQQGRLKIIDRIKNVIKLAQGSAECLCCHSQADTCSEYVALERIEGVYLNNPNFSAFLLYGDSTQSTLVAFGVVDPLRATDLVQKVLNRSIAPDNIVELEKALQEKKVKQEILTQLAAQSRAAKMNGSAASDAGREIRSDTSATNTCELFS